MTDQNPYAIVTEDLELWYGDFQALEKVSLNLRAGIITGLIGPSGCGKTTLLRAIAGLTPSRGLLTFNDDTWQNDTVNVPSHRRRLRFLVFPRFSLHVLSCYKTCGPAFPDKTTRERLCTVPTRRRAARSHTHSRPPRRT